MSSASAQEAYPSLTDEQWTRLKAYGTGQAVEVGTVLFRAGDSSYDLILVESGVVESSVAESGVVESSSADVVGAELGRARQGSSQTARAAGEGPGRAAQVSPFPHREYGAIFTPRNGNLDSDFDALLVWH